MPRKPTGKRVPRDDGTYVVVNKAANRAGTVFHVPERTHDPVGRPCPHPTGALAGDVSGPGVGRSNARVMHLPVTRSLADETKRSRTLSIERLVRGGLAVKRRRWRTSPRGGWHARSSLACRLRDQVPRAPRPTRPARRVPIKDVTPAQVADWQTWLLTTPRSNGRILSATTVADTRTTVRQLFSPAVDLELIRTNPVDRVKPPESDRSAGTGADVGRGGPPDRRDRSAPLRRRGGHPVHGGPESERGSRPGLVRHRPRRRHCPRPPGGRRQRRGPNVRARRRPLAPRVHHLAEGTVERLRAWRRRDRRRSVWWPDRCGKPTPTNRSSSIQCSPSQMAGSSLGNRSTSCCVVRGTNRDRRDASRHPRRPPHGRDDALHGRHRHRRHRPARRPCQPDDHVRLRGQPRRSSAEDRRARRQAARHTDVALDEAMMSPAREPV